MSALEETLLLHLRAAGVPPPVREVRFAAPRRWRFDLAWPEVKLAAEIEGGTWVSGRHGSGKGMEQDAEKYNHAVILGWRVLRFTTDMVKDGRALATIEKALSGNAVVELARERLAHAADVAARRSAGARLGWEIRKMRDRQKERG